MQGIIVGADRRQEWLLPWWWKHYSAHQGDPVLFVDFGMSKEAIDWCRERGRCVPLKGFERFSEREVPEEKRQVWEREISSLFSVRTVFFKKPFALLQSPWPLSVWLDLDCQVRGSLDPLFHCLHFGGDIAVRKRGEGYNAGVIAFRAGAPILHSWVDEVVERNDLYPMDENALSKLLVGCESAMELPDVYNWNPLHGPNPHAVILHYQGGFLKEEIKKTFQTGAL